MTNRKWTAHKGAMATALVALGALTALEAAGCRANGGDSYCDNTGCYECDGYSCRSVSPPSSSESPTAPGEPVWCGTTSDCSPGSSCVAHACVVGDAGTVTTTDAGASATDSGAATRDSGGSASDSGTAPIDAGPTCGNGNGACACTTTTTCATGQVCAGGACTTTSNACQYSSQCAAGQVCANNQCVASCDAAGATCASGSTCTKGVCEPTPVGTTCTTAAQCGGSTPVCAAGTCAPACSASVPCPTGDYCNQGACQVDTRPTPNCTQQSDCTGGSAQECLGGYCRYVCTSSAQCTDIDVRIDVCSATVTDAGAESIGYCESPAEATPQCTSQSQCPSGDDCIGNVCE